MNTYHGGILYTTIQEYNGYLIFVLVIARISYIGRYEKRVNA